MDPSWKGKCSDRQETLISLNAFLHIPTTVVILYSRCVSCKTAHISLISRDMTDLFFSMRIFAMAFLDKGSVKEISCHVKRLGRWGWRWHLQAKILPLLA